MASTEKQEQILKETLLLVKLFFETNASDTELSKRTGISSSTVGRRLTNKEIILKCFPSGGEKVYELIREKRKSNLERAKVFGGQVSQRNNSNFSKLRIDAIYSSKQSQIKFLSHLALYFRIKLPLLSELFGIDEKTLLNDLIINNKGCYESLLYLFYQDNFNQDLAKERVISYYKDLINAISKKDKDTQSYLINLIGDSKVKDFMLSHKNGSVKSDDEVMNILIYQLKYSLSNNKICEKFRLSRSGYANRVRELIKDNQELSERYETLTSNYGERSASMWK